MTPTLIGIIFVCVLVVLFAPVAWSVAMPLGRALWQRYIMFEWPHILSSIADVPDVAEKAQEQRSQAMEQGWEQPGTAPSFHVPTIVEDLEQYSDDELLDILACMQTGDGAERFSDSRIAKFIGGRIEDRIAQVRTIRAKHPPARDARAIPVSERGAPPRALVLE